MKKIILLTIGLALFCACGPANRTPIADGGESVNIGYGSVTQDQLTTSVSKVKIRENEIATYNDIYDYLRGRVPGVQVMPGDPPRIIIRGLGTISNETDPLILVDGVEMTDISGISPRDVGSIEVLKDGSSSIYGVRGANGVILITTKR